VVLKWGSFVAGFADLLDVACGAFYARLHIYAHTKGALHA